MTNGPSENEVTPAATPPADRTPDSADSPSELHLGKAVVRVLVLVAPIALHQRYPSIPVMLYVTWYGMLGFGYLLSAIDIKRRPAKKWVYENWLSILTLLIAVLVFFFIPQVRFVWLSQTPSLESGGWVVQWSAFMAVALIALFFFGVSFYVVPRRIRPVPADAGWWRRTVLRFADICISWPVWLWNFVRRSGGFVLGAVVVGMTWSFWPDSAPDAALIADRPLTAITCHHFCIWLLLMGCWLCITSLLVKQKDADADALAPNGQHPVIYTLGRLLGWLFWLYAIDEGIWLACAFEMISYRVYAMVAILFVLMLAGVVAGSLDFLDRNLERIPIRLIAIPVLCLGFLLIRPQLDSDVAVHRPQVVEGQVVSKTPSEFGQAYHHLEMRIRSIPEETPIVLVAASGGGSRAAIFTSLVYELLARRQLAEDPAATGKHRVWADNIVLISSVSGGSLATAHFVHRSCEPSAGLRELNYTIPAELTEGVCQEIERLIDRADADSTDSYWLKSREQARNLRKALADPQDDDTDEFEWIVANEFMDDMCVNFMAPILRGGLSVTMFRGAALSSFWDNVYDWRGSSNLDGYIRPKSTDLSAWYSPGRHPVVLFNACNVDDGARVSIGFPPLPRHAFEDSDDQASRFAPKMLALQDSDVTVETSLSQAVRFSANFPWGFNSSQIDTTAVKPDGQADLKLIDGGVSDNTGIDSIYELINGMRQPGNEHGQRLLRLLKSRRIVLLEIDSGAKPSSSATSSVMDVFHPVTGPVRAMSNAAYNNAEIAKQNYVDGILRVLRETSQEPDKGATDESGTSDAESSTTAADSNTTEENATTDADPNDLNELYWITVRCNHFDPKNPDLGEVMTAWALSPQQKASVIARFAVEIGSLAAKLRKFEGTEKTESPQVIAARANRDMAMTRLEDALEARIAEVKELNRKIEGSSQQESEMALMELFMLNRELQSNNDKTTQLTDLVRQSGDARTERIRYQIEELQQLVAKHQDASEAYVIENNITVAPGVRFNLMQFEPQDFRVLVEPPDPEQTRKRLMDAQEESRSIHRSLKMLDKKGKRWFSNRPEK